MHDTCSTHDRAFLEYGIDSTVDLVTTTHLGLTDRDVAVGATPAFVDAVGTEFRGAYVDAADVPIVPERVEAAVADAEATLAHELLDGAVPADAEALRTEIVPRFVALVGQFFCAYRGALDAYEDVGIWFEK